jgi:hypothetical protein
LYRHLYKRYCIAGALVLYTDRDKKCAIEFGKWLAKKTGNIDPPSDSFRLHGEINEKTAALLTGLGEILQPVQRKTSAKSRKLEIVFTVSLNG